MAYFEFKTDDAKNAFSRMQNLPRKHVIRINDSLAQATIKEIVTKTMRGQALHKGATLNSRTGRLERSFAHSNLQGMGFELKNTAEYSGAIERGSYREFPKGSGRRLKFQSGGKDIFVRYTRTRPRWFMAKGISNIFNSPRAGDVVTGELGTIFKLEGL